MESVYPDYPGVDSLNLNEGDRDLWVDLRPYTDTTAHTINEVCSLQNKYKIRIFFVVTHMMHHHYDPKLYRVFD